MQNTSLVVVCFCTRSGGKVKQRRQQGLEVGMGSGRASTGDSIWRQFKQRFFGVPSVRKTENSRKGEKPERVRDGNLGSFADESKVMRRFR